MPCRYPKLSNCCHKGQAVWTRYDGISTIARCNGESKWSQVDGAIVIRIAKSKPIRGSRHSVTMFFGVCCRVEGVGRHGPTKLTGLVVTIAKSPRGQSRDHGQPEFSLSEKRTQPIVDCRQTHTQHIQPMLSQVVVSRPPSSKVGDVKLKQETLHC